MKDAEMLKLCEWCKQPPETWSKPGEPHTAAVRCVNTRCPVRSAGWVSPGFWNTRLPVASTAPGVDAELEDFLSVDSSVNFITQQERVATPPATKEEEARCKCGADRDDPIHSFSTEWQQMHTFMPATAPAPLVSDCGGEG